MKEVIIIGHADVGKSCMTEVLKEYNNVLIEVKEIERPKEEVFLITAPPKFEPLKEYFPIKEKQPWRERRKNNWKSKRKK